MSLVVNFFGGPGCGKTLVMADVYQKLKKQDCNVEMVMEYAKELVWEDKLEKLKDQKAILDTQNSRIERLDGKVDVILTDSPIMLSPVYFHLRNPDASEEEVSEFTNYVKEKHDSYNNLNYYLQRLEDATYIAEGRADDEETSKSIDDKIVGMLNEENINFIRSSSLYPDKITHDIILRIGQR